MALRFDRPVVCALVLAVLAVLPPARAETIDEEGGESPDPRGRAGLRFRDTTLVTPAEREAADPYYRLLVERILDGTADARVMRRHAWLRPRLEPFTRVLDESWRLPARARLLAPAPATSRRDATRAPAAAVTPSVGRWVPYGPTTVPGRVTGLARPAGAGPGTVLASMADGGLWWTRDAGAHWEPLAELEATQAAGSITTDPLDPKRWFLGTGEGNGSGDNYGGIGMLRTTDGGRTWSVSNFFSGNVRCGLVDPANRQRVYACSDAGLYRSDDGGATFAQVGGDLPVNRGTTRVLVRPDDPSVLYVSYFDYVLHRSTDGGATWTALYSPVLRYSGWGRTDIAMCASNPDVLVFAAEDTGAGSVYRSVDGGLNWTWLQNAPGLCSGQCWYDLSVGIAPDDCDTIYLGGISGFVSRDGGESFTVYPADTGSHADPTAVHVDHHAVLPLPGGEVFVGTDGGVYRSTDFGASWRDVGQGLPTTQYYALCASDTVAGTFAGGTQDNGTHRRRDADGWSWVLGGDGGMCAFGGAKVMGEFQQAQTQRSLDGGTTWQDATGGLGNELRPWVGPIARDPQDANTVYLGTQYVYRTTDFHDTDWRRIWTGNNAGVVSALAMPLGSRFILWAGFSNGGVWRTLNALSAPAGFTNVTGPIPMRTVTRIVPQPGNVSAAWVTIGGTTGPRVFFTPDLGTSWQDRTGDFPPVQINDLFVDPGDVNVLIAGTDLGVFRSGDGGAHWYGFADGLPTAAVLAVVRHPVDGTLVAGTHGRSTFRFQPASAGAVAVPDGDVVPGTMMLAERTGDGRLWVRWDSTSCTAERYHLFYGRLADLATRTYLGAECNLPRGGEAIVPMPGPASESLFFTLVGATASGTEGPHGYDATGTPSPASGVGFCGVVAHAGAASCP